MYKFMKQNYIEVEIGILYLSYQQEVATITAFDQRQLKHPKMQNLIEKKSQKLTKQSWNMCQFWTRKAF